MRDNAKRSLWRVVLCVILFIIVGTVGAVVCQSGRVRTIPPGGATEVQVRLATKELREFLQEAGRSQAEINRIVRALERKYLSESTDRCSDEESGKTEKER